MSIRIRKHLALAICTALWMSGSAFSQSLTIAQEKFLNQNSKTICEDSLQTQHQWDAMLPHLTNKRLILLGELNHGSKEMFQLRNSLIRYLDQTRGVKAILVEAGIGELIAADTDRDRMSSSEMVDGLFGVWRTKEFEALMDYVKSRNISIAGFDVQRTGGTFRSVLKAVVQRCKLDTLHAFDLESRYGKIASELTHRSVLYDSVEAKTKKLIHDYQKLKELLTRLVAGETERDLLLTIKTLENRVSYLDYMLKFVKDKNWHKRWAARDSVMANNAQWLVENFYKDQTVVMIGHNFHMGKYNAVETVMGEILKVKYDKKMYSIGFFGGSGSYLDNSGKTLKMAPPDATVPDIKHIIAHMHDFAAFLDVPDKFSRGSDWLDADIVVNDTFIDLRNSNRMSLSRTFDGLIFVKKISPTKPVW